MITMGDYVSIYVGIRATPLMRGYGLGRRGVGIWLILRWRRIAMRCALTWRRGWEVSWFVPVCCRMGLSLMNVEAVLRKMPSSRVFNSGDSVAFNSTSFLAY